MRGGGRWASQSKPTGPKRRIISRAFGLFHSYRWHALALIVLVATTVSLSLYSLTVLAGLVGEMTAEDGTRGGLTRGFLIYGGIIVAEAWPAVWASGEFHCPWLCRGATPMWSISIRMI